MPQHDAPFTPRLTGRDYVTPDLRAKLTGTARFTEDFRAEGMLACKLLTSPMPHAKVTRLDTRAALAVPGVRAILTAEDLPAPADSVTDTGAVIRANKWAEPALTMEPLYAGEPVLAVAAETEAAAAEAIAKIDVAFSPLPFVIDPLDSLRPGGPAARGDGNVWLQPPAGPDGAPSMAQVGRLSWTEADFAAAGPHRLPLGKPSREWAYGDLEAGFAQAALVLDETFVTPNVSHQTLETRSTLAYWQNGKVFIHTGTQSTMQTVPAISRWLGIPPDRIVFISEFTGGGFGSKGTAGISLVIPALLAKKANAPVMMRVGRELEQAIGRARPSCIGRLRAGFAADGRLLALDMYVVQDNGPYEENNDAAMSGRIASLLYQPQAMRWRGLAVLTNTPTRMYQTAPGGVQAVMFMDRVLAKAARELKLDQVAIRRVNAPAGKAPFGAPGPDGKRPHATSAFIKEALDQGAAAFGWQARQALPRDLGGGRRRGLGVGLGSFVAGTIGFDGLFVVTPEGRLRIHCGIGNLGTESFSDVQRVLADAMDVPWEACEIVWGDTGKHLPWSCVSGGSQTIHAMSRAALAASLDAKKKLKEIAAQTLGGAPEDYAVAGGRVSRASDGRGLDFGEAARRAMALGGAYDGHEIPAGLHALTKASAQALAGQGLLAVAKDTFPRDGQSFSYVATFAEVEVDTATGMYRVVDFHAAADSGVVVHPRAFGGQVVGRSMLGLGHVTGQRWVFDRHYGMPLGSRFYQTKPPTILELPQKTGWSSVGIPDPETPIGARGIGEPPTGAAAAALLNALSDALGDDRFRRAPILPDMILASLEPDARPRDHGLSANV